MRLSVKNAIFCLCILNFVRQIAFSRHDGSSYIENVVHNSTSGQRRKRRHYASKNDNTTSCAINFHGAARSFASMSLPSIVKNIIQPNAHYGCDYFVHFHNLGFEKLSRAGVGGELDPTEVYRLKDAVSLHEISRPSLVAFSNSTEDEFRSLHADLLLKMKTEKDSKGNYVYQRKAPLNDRLYNFDTTTNIVKMWHNLRSVWKLMADNEQRRGSQYNRIAMIRLDCVYVTPIDIFRHEDLSPEEKWNATAIIPAFAEYPVNDRFVSGPRGVVKAWANRFDYLDYHIDNARKKNPHIGIHSEEFLHKTTFPLLRDAGYNIIEDTQMCFLRSRPGNIVWARDCKDRQKTKANKWMSSNKEVQKGIEWTIDRKCTRAKSYRRRAQLQCP